MESKNIIGALPAGTSLTGGQHEYRIVKPLGQGGYGITYLATAMVQVGNIKAEAKFAIKEHFDQKLNCRVGTEAVISNPTREWEVKDSINSFMVEAERLAELKYPYIVPVNESFRANNTAYYVMQYIDGGNLTDMVKNASGGRLSEEQALSIIKTIADALSYLHKRRMLHLDVKPDNILMQDGQKPVLIDFGLVKRYDKSGKPTTTNKAAGVSDGYAPLEQYAGITSFTPEADVYALAATLLYMLTGKTPYKAGQMPSHLIQSWLEGVASKQVIQATIHAMETLKDSRTHSVKEFVAELFGERESDDNKPLPSGYVLCLGGIWYQIQGVQKIGSYYIKYTSVPYTNSVHGNDSNATQKVGLSVYEYFEHGKHKRDLKGIVKESDAGLHKDKFLALARKETGESFSELSHPHLFEYNGTIYFIEIPKPPTPIPWSRILKVGGTVIGGIAGICLLFVSVPAMVKGCSDSIPGTADVVKDSVVVEQPIKNAVPTTNTEQRQEVERTQPKERVQTTENKKPEVKPSTPESDNDNTDAVELANPDASQMARTYMNRFESGERTSANLSKAFEYALKADEATKKEIINKLKDVGYRPALQLSNN